MSHDLRVMTRIESATDSLFLTFDDGPDPIGTPAVLDLLRKHECHATFFLIAEKAEKNPELVLQIAEAGHSIGNHSLNHSYGIFFANLQRMKSWIENSTAAFRKLGVTPIGFRPPAGVRTPKLHQALADLNIPLIMWEKRFFDTTLPFTKGRALRSLHSTNPGSIILLHDRQRPKRLSLFLETLEIYLQTGKAKGLQFRALTEEECKPKVASTTNSNA